MSSLKQKVLQTQVIGKIQAKDLRSFLKDGKVLVLLEKMRMTTFGQNSTQHGKRFTIGVRSISVSWMNSIQKIES